MYNDNSLYLKVKQIYDNRKIAAADKAFLLRQKLNADAVFSDNSQKLKNAGFLRQKYQFEGDIKKAEEYTAEYTCLKKERAEILKKYGISETDLENKFECAKCEDTGFLPGGGTCDCYYKTVNAVINETLGISERKLPSFEDYIAENDQEKKLKEKFLTYCAKFPDLAVKNLVLIGTTGTGKTFAAGCIANELKKANLNVIFLSAVKANDLFLKYHSSKDADRRIIFGLLTDCDLLIIDDLGTEPILKNVTVEYLTAVLSERLADEKPFIITSNLNPKEMINRYTERLVSRLSDSSTAIMSFTEKDKRRGI